jgi:hypothetical protein
LASVSYNSDGHPISYERFMQAKLTIAENIMPSTIPVTSGNQEMVLPISHHMFNQKSEVLNGPTPSPLLQKPVVLMGGLERYPMQHSASAPEIKNLWNGQSNMPNISSRTALDNLAEVYFNSVREVDLISFN